MTTRQHNQSVGLAFRVGTIGDWTRANAGALVHRPADRIYARRASADTTIYRFGTLEVIQIDGAADRTYTRRTPHFHADAWRHIHDTYALL